MIDSVSNKVQAGKQAGRKGLQKVIFGRTVVLLLLLVVQVAVLFFLARWLQGDVAYVYSLSVIFSFFLAIHIINRDINPSFQIAWLIPVLLVPVMGVVIYIFFQMQIGARMTNNRLRLMIRETAPYLEQDPEVTAALRNENMDVANLAHYIDKVGGYPAYKNTQVTYFPLGEDKFAEMLRQLEGARKFIFMEYFIVEEGIMWNSVLEILKRKAKQGVEVRFMYDGMCSLALLPHDYPKVLIAYGIQCKMFAPIRPILSTIQNNRDHRKILVIDGHTAFTGGINLADEYINQKVRFGHWKDTAVMLKGDAVKNFTMMFLQMWNINGLAPEAYIRYIQPEVKISRPAEGYVIPYGDSPLDNENVGALVYQDIIQHARRYVHIFTPYLVLDNETAVSLKYAAKRGVDVRLVLPHIPDKKYAYLLARTHYPAMIQAGVKIYEYMPGFMHAKVFVADDEICTVGTVNLDFRSLYLHFECGVYVYKNPVVDTVEQDFQNTLQKCKRITGADCRDYPLIKKYIGRVLRLFAPLM